MEKGIFLWGNEESCVYSAALPCQKNMSTRYFFSHPVSFTHLHRTLEFTAPAIQHKWRTCVGQPQRSRGMPPKSQSTHWEDGSCAPWEFPRSPLGMGHEEALFLEAAWDWGPNGSWACVLALCSCSGGSQDLWRYLSLFLLCPLLLVCSYVLYGHSPAWELCGNKELRACSLALESLLWCSCKDGLISSSWKGVQKGKRRYHKWNLVEWFWGSVTRTGSLGIFIMMKKETDFCPSRFFQLF